MDIAPRAWNPLRQPLYNRYVCSPKTNFRIRPCLNNNMLCEPAELVSTVVSLSDSYYHQRYRSLTTVNSIMWS